MCGIFLIIVINLIEHDNEELKTETFKNEYGTIIEGIDLKGVFWDKAYYIIFLYRRLVYAAILAILYQYPMLQLVLSLVITCIPVLI